MVQEKYTKQFKRLSKFDKRNISDGIRVPSLVLKDNAVNFDNSEIWDGITDNGLLSRKKFRKFDEAVIWVEMVVIWLLRSDKYVNFVKRDTSEGKANFFKR